MAPLFPILERPDDRPLLRVDDREVTAREFAAHVSAHVRRLESLGIAPGDRVVVPTLPSLETCVALVGNAISAVVSVPMHPSIGQHDLAHVLGRVNARCIFGRAFPELPAASRSLAVYDIATPTSDRHTLETVAEDDSPLLVLFTSGTTGPPKGAVLTSRNVTSNLDGLGRAWAWSERDRIVHALPIFHVHGLVLGLFGGLRRGGGLTWLPRFDAATLAAAAGERDAVLFAVPTMYHRLLDRAESDADTRNALQTTRLLVSGSAALPKREHARAERLFGRAIVERYGLTETLINCVVRNDAPRPGYVGAAVDGVEVALVDDHRTALDAWDDATLGEIAVKGPNVFAGYLDDAAATEAVMDDGWFFTGDIAARAPDGCFRIVGRRSTDLIKTGGFKVGAGEVEACLLESESVAEAAVVGMSDPDLGERIVAFVVPRPNVAIDGAALIARVAEELAPYKRPREVRVVSELPRNAMGKVQKSKLKAESYEGERDVE